MTQPGIVAVGPFPPFVGGAAKNTAIICDELENRGTRVTRLPTNKTRGRAEHSQSLSYYVDRTSGFLGNVARMIAASRKGRNSTVYLIPDGGPGIAFSAVYARIAAARFGRLVVHHRNYSHVREHNDLMARLVEAAPVDTFHVFLDPIMEDKFRRLYSTHIRSMYVPNAATCDLEASQDQPDVDSDSPVTIGFLSNLVEDKGFDVVAEAFPMIAERLGSQARFLLAGRPVGELNNARIEAMRQSIGERLDYRGEVFGEQKRRFFEACDIFVFPSRFGQEGQPNVLYEAMAAGAAIVSTDWAGIPWVLSDSVSRTIQPGSEGARDLVSAVEDLIRSGELRTARRRQIEAFLSKKADADERYAQFIELLRGDD